MTWRRRPVTAATLLIVMMKVFTGHSLTCLPEEYELPRRCCPMCPPGSRVRTDCIDLKSTSCLSCTEGSYMDKPTGRRRCFDCRTCAAGSGLKVKTSCTLTSDAACEPEDGFYCIDSKDGSCAAAQKHRRCRGGEYVSQNGTSSTDAECSACSAGTFSDGTFPSCQPHRQCESEDRPLVTAGTASTDAQCGEHSSDGTAVVTGVAVGVSLVFLVLIFTAVLIFYFKKKKTSLTKGRNGSAVTASSEKTGRAEGAEMIPMQAEEA